MGLLFSRLWSYFANKEHKIIIIGLDNAGKTTILYQFLMNEVVHTSPTIGSNVETVKWKNINFVMWDIGGQESLRQSWNTYFANTEFVIFVIDSSDQERMALSKGEFHKIISNDDLKKAAILIFANKQDIKGASSAADISKYLNLTSLKNNGWHIQACCALSGQGGDLTIYLPRAGQDQRLPLLPNPSPVAPEVARANVAFLLSLYQGLEWLTNKVRNKE